MATKLLFVLIALFFQFTSAGKNDLYKGVLMIDIQVKATGESTDYQKIKMIYVPDGHVKSRFCALQLCRISVPSGDRQRHNECTCVQYPLGCSLIFYRVKIRDHSDVNVLKALILHLDLDVWSHGYIGYRDAIIMVSPENKNEFLNTLDGNGIDHLIHLEDLVKALDEHDEMILKWRRKRNGRLVPFEDYPRYAEVNEYMERLAAQYPNIVTLVNAGPSFEGRDIKYLKISTTNFRDTSKPVYFMDAAMHSREWVTTPVALYSMHRLVEGLVQEDRDLLEQVDWIILPMVNPDGYEFSHTNNRMWRKSRSQYPQISTSCYGVDINRNFNISFNTIGVSSNPCSDVYPGPVAFSEVEAQYIRDILYEHLNRTQLYLNIHSFGNMILFGYDDLTFPPNAVDLHYVGSVMGAAIDTVKLPISPHYVVGNGAFILYGVSGSSQDYVQFAGVPFSYTLELPEFDWYDFRVPPEYIGQLNMETWRGIAASARACILFYKQRYNSQNNDS